MVTLKEVSVLAFLPSECIVLHMCLPWVTLNLKVWGYNIASSTMPLSRSLSGRLDRGSDL
jgi:hypothetical protein